MRAKAAANHHKIRPFCAPASCGTKAQLRTVTPIGRDLLVKAGKGPGTVEGRLRERLLSIYVQLRERFGPSHWWPAESAFEVCVGAFLTQGTSWANVERALDSLRRRGRLSFHGLAQVPASRLAPWIRSSGFYQVKAQRLRAFVRFLGREHGGEVRRLRKRGLAGARADLLALPGVGPETADAILLYAAGLPTFVVDSYTRRVFRRLGILGGDESYEEVRQTFLRNLPRRVGLYNDYHAQIVTLAKTHCRSVPRCTGCPLGADCPRTGVGDRAKIASRGASRFRRER